MLRFDSFGDWPTFVCVATHLLHDTHVPRRYVMQSTFICAGTKKNKRYILTFYRDESFSVLVWVVLCALKNFLCIKDNFVSRINYISNPFIFHKPKKSAKFNRVQNAVVGCTINIFCSLILTTLQKI